MWYKDEIGSGWELGDKLWSGAKTNFDDWIEHGADADDILNAVEEIFGYDEEPPTLTAINDLLWFEPETIEEFLGLSSEDEEIESACHGQSKKDEKKKPVKSSRKSITDYPELQMKIYEYISYGKNLDHNTVEENVDLTEKAILEEYPDLDVDELEHYIQKKVDEQYYTELDSSHRPVQSAMPGKEKGIQAIMDEYGCSREEAEEIMNEQIDSGRKPVKSSWEDDKSLPFDPADVDTITAEDIREAREAIENNPQSTWYKVLYTFDDGDKLCLTAGMRNAEDWGEEGYMPCMCLGVLPSNSGMSEYGYDFIMPYNPETGDVWDTEVSDFDESSLDWFNKDAVDMAQEVSEGKWSKE